MKFPTQIFHTESKFEMGTNYKTLKKQEEEKKKILELFRHFFLLKKCFIRKHFLKFTQF